MDIKSAWKTACLLSNLDMSAFSDDELKKIEKILIGVNHTIEVFFYGQGYIIENPGEEASRALLSEVAIRHVERLGYKFITNSKDIAPKTFMSYPEEWIIYQKEKKNEDEEEKNKKFVSSFWVEDDTLVIVPEIPFDYYEKLKPIIPKRYCVLTAGTCCCEEYFYGMPRTAGNLHPFILYD